MKFNKELDKVTHQYKYTIPKEHWFEYKKLKKLLKKAVNIMNNKLKYNPYAIQNYEEDSDDTCCICLENDKLMKLFCCNNFIHHTCLVQVLTSRIPCCPMCRCDILKVITYESDDDLKELNATILSIISVIHLNINKIEYICNSNIIKNQKLLTLYRHWNYIAVIKICKKIEKHLALKNIKEYFLNVMKKNNILAEHYKSISRPLECFNCILHNISHMIS
jgi:hypothetical protein